MILKVLVWVGCVILPGGAMVLAYFDGLKFDWTVNPQLIISAFIFICAGAVLVAKMPQMQKDIEAGKDSDARLGRDLARVSTILDGLEGRVGTVEDRLNNHLDNQRGMGAG